MQPVIPSSHENWRGRPALPATRWSRLFRICTIFGARKLALAGPPRRTYCDASTTAAYPVAPPPPSSSSRPPPTPPPHRPHPIPNSPAPPWTSTSIRHRRPTPTPKPFSIPTSRLDGGAGPSAWPPSTAPSPRVASASSSAPSTPASRTVYSDRFIPSRAGSNLALFDLPALAPTPSSASTPRARSAAAASAYCTLLRAELFGPDTPDRLASSAAACSSSASYPTSGNIFRFKAEFAVKRKAVRIWGCKDCGKVNAGGVYTMNTASVVTVRSTIHRLREQTEA